jgi:hypothetical protein
MDADAALALLKAILADTVRLPGASYLGRHELFDPVLGNGHRYRDQERALLTKAAQVCAECPMIQRRTSVTVVATVEIMPTPRSPAPPPGLLSTGTTRART